MWDSLRWCVDPESVTAGSCLPRKRLSADSPVSIRNVRAQTGTVELKPRYQIDTPRPIGYWSQTLTVQKRNLDATQCKCLTVIWAIMLIRPFSKDTRFTLRICYHAPHWILDLDDATGTLARWRPRLMKFDFEIIHRAGIKNQAANALSRLPMNGSDCTLLEDNISIMVVTWSNMEALNSQSNDAADVSHAKINSTFWNNSLKLLKFIEAHQTDTYWDTFWNYIGLPGTTTTYENDGILLREAPIDGEIKKWCRTHYAQGYLT